MQEDRAVHIPVPGGSMLAWYISKGVMYCSCGVEAEQLDYGHGDRDDPYLVPDVRKQDGPYGIFQCAGTGTGRHGGFHPLWTNPKPKEEEL